MAGRTSTSFGVAATITILGILCLGLFVLSAVFFGKFNDAKRNWDQALADQAEFVTSAERNSDDVRLVKEEAKRSGGKSVVGYLADSMQKMMADTTGNKRDSYASFAAKKNAIPGADTSPLLSVLASRDAEIATLKDNYAKAESARTQAQADQKNAVDRIKGIEDSHQKTVDSIKGEVGQYKQEVETYRAGADQYKGKVDAEFEKSKADFSETKKRLETQLAKLTDEKLILEAQLASLRGQKNLETFRGRAAPGSDRTAVISVGAKDKVNLGMTFAVYADKNSIRPDENGKYAPGKATLEVTSVDDSSATCRITSEVRGNPIVKGDVIANALYDPKKSYKFVVFGNFDTDRDRVATSLERQDIESMIQAWGGSLAPDLSGDVDFLVLGERPLLPPRPSADAPIEVVQEFIRRQRDVERYDSLFKNAVSTGIPTLNENRLYTLIGKTPARAH